MQFKNTENRFGLVSLLLHWFMALLLIFLVVLGLYMDDLPISFTKLKLYGWHKEWGMLALFLVMLRLVWRITNKLPSLSELPLWERLAARTVHYAFYGFMIALPITGWMLTSAAGLPVSFFGLFVLPDLVSANESLRLQLTTLHEWLGYGLIVTFCGHVLAALQHHFIKKDDILRRML